MLSFDKFITISNQSQSKGQASAEHDRGHKRLFFSNNFFFVHSKNYFLVILMFKKPSSIIVLLLLATIFSCSSPPTNKTENKLAGLWSLHIMEMQDSVTGEWNPWRGGMQGYLLYDNTDNMSMHLMTKDYEKTDLRFPNFTDTIPLEALKHLTNSYVYFAKYSVDTKKGIVQHARISHSNPKDWNEVVERRYSFKGDTLLLQPVEKTNAGLRLKWIKKKKEKVSKGD